MPRIASRPPRAAQPGRIAEGARKAGRAVGGVVNESVEEARGRRLGKDLNKQVGELKLLVIGLILLVVLTSGIWFWPYLFARQVVGQAHVLAAHAVHEQSARERQAEQEQRKAVLAAQVAYRQQVEAQRIEDARREHEALQLQNQQRTRDTYGAKLPPLRALRAEVVRAHNQAGLGAEDARAIGKMLSQLDEAIKGYEDAVRTGKADGLSPRGVAADEYRAQLAAMSTRYRWDAPIPDALAGNATGTILFRLEQLLAKVEPKLARVGARAPAPATAAAVAAKAAIAEAKGQAPADIDIDVLQARLDELRNASDELDLLE